MEGQKKTFQAIGKKFRLSGEVKSVTPISEKAYKVAYSDGRAYCFKEIIPMEGAKVEDIFHNVDLVANHLKSKSISAIHYHHTNLKEIYCELDGKIWLVEKYVQSKSFEISGYSQILALGKAIASFQLSLLDFDKAQLALTFPDRHNTRKLFDELKDDDSKEAKYLLESKEKACKVYDAFVKGEIPTRVTHNHTKAENILFVDQDSSLAIIGLDYVQPGISLYDFATGCISGCKVDDGQIFDLKRFKAYLRGYLPGARQFLTEEETKLIGDAIYAVIAESAAFNLARYQNEGHPMRLDKAKRYIHLAKNFESKEGKVQEIIEECLKLDINPNALIDALDREAVNISSQTDYKVGDYMDIKFPHKVQIKGGACYAFFKRTFDVLMSLTALIVLSPLMLLAGLGVKLTSKGPMIYVSKRVGKNGKIFKFYKFRSMYQDAEQRLDELLALNEVEGGVTFKIKNDPRITPFGKFLRKTSIDELPQLINILKGDMSIIGPRPGLPREIKLYPEEAKDRLLVPQGLSGEWQANGRSDTSFENMVRMDLDYIQNKRGFCYDIKLIFKTICVVFSHKGAE